MSENHDWSNLCPDLLRSIFGILNTKDFHRTRTVCSNWYVVSATCKRNIHPWRIIFREKPKSTLLFDPEDDDKIRVFEHPELDLSEYSKTKTYCIAISSNWLLVADLLLNFYLLNVFTREKIHLPTLELSFLGFEREDDLDDSDEWDYFYIKRSEMISLPALLWINERTRDYVVSWAYRRNLFTFKKGDEAWRRNLQGTNCSDLAFKDNKLYVFTLDNYIKILDFSGDAPRESLENPYLNHRFRYDMAPTECIWKRRLLITNSGEVLVIQSSRECKDKYLFQIFKMNLESGKWERVDSLGDEMLIFGRGVTVRTSANDGGSIFFGRDDFWPDQKTCGVFHLATSTVTCAEPVSDIHYETARWFFPGYALKS